jgi:hypothetical protein
MSAGSGKLVTANESTVVAEFLFDLIMMEDCEGDRCLPDPPCADESDRFEVFSEFDDLFNQLVTSKTIPRGRGRRFTRRDATKRKATGPP